MSGARAVLAAALAAAFTATLVVCSRLPYVADERSDALIRLSWRAVGERVEECRQASAEELAALPRHMRRQEICEGRLAPFDLSVALDGEPLYTGLVRASGAREDRPTYVFREFAVAPGTHQLVVHFGPHRDDMAGAPLALDETLALAPRQILLITQNPDTDQLIVFDPAS